MELFAQRNRVNQQYPFVTSMYLFNNQDQCVKEHYYAITLSAEKEQEVYYQNMQQWFKLEKNRYACVADRDNLNILFRIYDDNMKEKGIGIAQISCDAIREIFKEIEDYQDSSWIVLSNNDLLLVSGGDEKQNELMKETSVSWVGNKKIEGSNWECRFEWIWNKNCHCCRTEQCFRNFTTNVIYLLGRTCYCIIFYILCFLWT